MVVSLATHMLANCVVGAQDSVITMVITGLSTGLLSDIQQWAVV